MQGRRKDQWLIKQEVVHARFGRRLEGFVPAAVDRPKRPVDACALNYAYRPKDELGRGSAAIRVGWAERSEAQHSPGQP